MNCLLAGLGGQGTVLLSRLIGGAALERGLDVRGAETIGMAQRGGSVVSHIRMGGPAGSPLIPPGRADLIIAFEAAEAVRALPFLSESGRLLLLNRAVPPAAAGASYDPRRMSAYLAARLGVEGEGRRLFLIDGDELLRRCGSPRVLNTALLGAALKLGFFPFAAEDALRVLSRRVPERYLELNRRALELGGELVG
jgi:indolepyruvate ferredoxin oxidoreductase beta subunit